MAASDLTMHSEAAIADRVVDVQRRLGVSANASAVMAGKTLTMGLGFVFWLVAAHEFTRTQVGLAAAVVAAMMLCTQLAIGGVGSAVITCYGEYRRRPEVLLDTSGTAVTLAALAVGSVFLVAAGLGLHHLGVVATNPWYAVSFLVVTVLGTVAILLDQVSIALGRGDQVLVRGLAFGSVTVAGIALLPLVLDRASSFAIFLPWLLAGVVNVGLGVVQLRRLVPGYRFRPRLDRPVRRELLRHGFPNYALTLAERAPGLVLPVVVAEVLSPDRNATWYAVWMMAWVVYTMPISAGLTLFAEGSNRPAKLHEATREAVRVALLVGLGGALFLALFAHWTLSLLGSSYGASGASPLRILLLAFVPLTFLQAYLATSRARRRLGEALVVGWVTAVASVAAATVGAVVGGLVGIACGWLLVQTAAGAWAVSRNPSVWDPWLDGFRRSRAAVAPLIDPVVRAVSAVDRVTALALASIVVALGAWATSLHGVELGQMNALGLASVLPPTFYAAVVLVTVAFAVTLLQDPVRQPLLFVLVIVLIVMLFALTPILESVPRFAVTWRHVGITQEIADSGRVNPRIDAYFNWPGFFAFAGAVSRLAGFRNALPLASWAPVYLNLAYLAPLLVIARSLTASPRVVWLSVWMFYVGNSIGQDYFSPQGFSFFLYLLILAILLRWFTERPRWSDGVEPEPAEPGGVVPRRLLVCVLFLYAASVPTHQLTPVAIVFGAGAVVVVGARRLFWLPVLMGGMMLAWWATGARTFLNGHLGRMLGQTGKLDSAFAANVSNRVGGDVGHRIVADLTLCAGAAMWGLAFVGALRLLRQSRWHRMPVALAGAPIPLAVMQTYGGEMLLRVQLFALPFTAFLAAGALVGDHRRDLRPPVRKLVLVIGALIVLSGLFVFARYGNERVDRFTPDERAAVAQLYALAQPGSTLVAGTGNLPWKYRDYAAHRYRLVTDMPHWVARAAPSARLGPLLRDVRGAMLQSHPPAYLIITRSEEVESDQFGLGRPGALARFAEAIKRSSLFTAVYHNPDASIFVLAPPRVIHHHARPVAKPKPKPASGRRHVVTRAHRKHTVTRAHRKHVRRP